MVNISSKCFAIYFKVGYSHSEIRNASHCDAAHHSRHLVSLGRWWISSCAGVWAERESRQWEQERVTDIAKCHRALVIWQTWYFGHDPLPAESGPVCVLICVYVCVYTAYRWNRPFFTRLPSLFSSSGAQSVSLSVYRLRPLIQRALCIVTRRAAMSLRQTHVGGGHELRLSWGPVHLLPE